MPLNTFLHFGIFLVDIDSVSKKSAQAENSKEFYLLPVVDPSKRGIIKHLTTRVDGREAGNVEKGETAQLVALAHMIS
ncbi:hypothetical protein U1Q18_026519 [Sarracenia purpurea var. burkii]